MADVGPMTITARNAGQAEYLIRTRAQQRGVDVRDVVVEDAGGGAWFVTVRVDESDAAKVAAAALGEDTQVMHLRTHPRPTDTDG